MKDVMKIWITMLGLLLAATSVPCGYGQAAPAAIATPTVGPNLPNLDGIVHYALSASEFVQLGYYGPGQVTSSTALSGDVAYTSKSVVRPFSMLFAGGLLFPNGSGQGFSTYQNIAVSQGLVTRHWVFNISDTFSFLPESPTTGLSGIAGVGDLGSVPVQGPGAGPAGGVLTISGDRISNSLSGSVERQLSRDTSISGGGSWSKLHFLGEDDGAGLDSTSVAGSVAVNRRLDARSSVSLGGSYSTYSYSGPGSGPATPSFTSEGISISYSRVLSRTLSLSASIGPQRVSSSNSVLVPTRIFAGGGVGLSYSRRYTTASLNYSRGVNAGSGAVSGAISDNISGGVGRTYGRDWSVGVSAAYTRTSGLTNLQVANSIGDIDANSLFNTVYGGFQVTRRINSNFSAYGSYTATDQTANSAFAGQNALNGVSQTFGAGITFSPRSTRLGQF
jgi:hypothetical protein